MKQIECHKTPSVEPCLVHTDEHVHTDINGIEYNVCSVTSVPLNKVSSY